MTSEMHEMRELDDLYVFDESREANFDDDTTKGTGVSEDYYLQLLGYVDPYEPMNGTAEFAGYSSLYGMNYEHWSCEDGGHVGGNNRGVPGDNNEATFGRTTGAPTVDCVLTSSSSDSGGGGGYPSSTSEDLETAISDFSDNFCETERTASSRSSVVSLPEYSQSSVNHKSSNFTFLMNCQISKGAAMDKVEFVRLASNQVDLNFMKIPLVDQLRASYPIYELCQKAKTSHQCSHCNEDFCTIIELAGHFDKFKICTTHKCPFSGCPFQLIGFARKADLRRHCLSKHFEKGKLNETVDHDVKHVLKNLIYTCSYETCQKNFYRKDSLQRHMKLVHDNQNSKFNKKLKKLSKVSKCHKHKQLRHSYKN